MLQVEVHEAGGITVIAPSGDIDLATARPVGNALVAAAADGAARVVLDLREVTFVDSSGIGMIIKMQRFFAVEGISFGVVKGAENVQRAFQLSHVEPLVAWTEAPG